jgi:hypothetical protein
MRHTKLLPCGAAPVLHQCLGTLQRNAVHTPVWLQWLSEQQSNSYPRVYRALQQMVDPGGSPSRGPVPAGRSASPSAFLACPLSGTQ